MPERSRHHITPPPAQAGVFPLPLLFAIISLLITACGSGGDADTRGLTSGPGSCDIPAQNNFVYSYLRDFYFWADEVADNATPDSYDSPQALLEDLKFQPLDRFSHISDAASFNSFQEGQFIGIGLYIVRDENDDPIVAFAHNGSPAADSGIKRGDLITEINGVRGESLRDRDQYSAAFGPSGEGNSVTLKVKPRGESSEVTHNLTTRLVTINPTPIVETLEKNGRKIGYLQFTNFFGNAVDDLNSSFATFKSEGIEELIVDLRYNGGGRLSTANHLASLMGGNRSNGDEFAKLIYNNQHPELNFTFHFSSPANQLSLQRVYILSSSATCSASEAVINGLRGAGLNNDPATPVEIIQIGSTTCGKPVGSNPQSFCNNVMPAITFELLNAQNQGRYFDGLAPQCEDDDDLQNDLGDSNESLLASALHHIEQGSCPTPDSATPDSDTSTPPNLPLTRNAPISR